MMFYDYYFLGKYFTLFIWIVIVDKKFQTLQKVFQDKGKVKIKTQFKKETFLMNFKVNVPKTNIFFLKIQRF